MIISIRFWFYIANHTLGISNYAAIHCVGVNHEKWYGDDGMVRTALGRPYGLVMISSTVEGTKRNAQIRNTERRPLGATQRVLPNLLVALVGGELKGLLTMHASVVETSMVKLPGFLSLSADSLTPRIARLRAPVAMLKEQERSVARYSVSRLCENGPCLLYFKEGIPQSMVRNDCLHKHACLAPTS